MTVEKNGKLWEKSVCNCKLRKISAYIAHEHVFSMQEGSSQLSRY